jgi:hypothetical protein
MIKFNENAIDLVKTCESLRKKHGRVKWVHQQSCADVIRMAEFVITTYFDWDSVKGVRACIEYEVTSISWRNSIWIFPLNEDRLFMSPFGEIDRQHISLLTDSIILSIIAYRIQLNEHHSGLSTIRFNQMIYGLEWLCGLIREGVTIDPTRIDEIESLDVQKTIGWIN